MVAPIMYCHGQGDQRTAGAARVLTLFLLGCLSIAITPAPADTQTVSLTDLRTLGGAFTSSQAKAINDAGQVVGDSRTDNGLTHAFL